MATTKKKTPENVTHLGTLVGEKREAGGKQARQQAFLQAYRASFFNISEACRQVGLGRRTFYHWKNEPAFVEDLETCREELKDYLKSKLLELVDKNNLIATIFACKTLGGLIELNRSDIVVSEGPRFEQNQLDAIVRGNDIDRSQYNKMLGLEPEPDH